ncbi:MAG: asparagine synthase (glutamine-hydrolyzing) [Nitrospiraceae bacterium]|nr:asparagine synthase (glutamine-hydrolyzing) [Nitrospiraceae bacterium]
MCGIAGIYSDSGRPSRELLSEMIRMLRHRGPDGFGLYADEKIGLAHARLSIIDLSGGGQPMPNEDKKIWITFNGEIFNYLELRSDLEGRGHVFRTKSDTETILHLYEEYGPACLDFLNGQFAFAIWDKGAERLFMARDRAGIRPLFYAMSGGSLLFASEIKSIFMDSRIKRELDPFALDQIFTFWMTIPPRTAFKNVFELPAGHFMVVQKGGTQIKKYWDPDFTPLEKTRTEAEYAEELKSLLIDATRLQLRADVPVGAYLSGGIDSSAVAALVKNHTETPLRTFSVSFEDGAYDEGRYQRMMAGHLGALTSHSSVMCGYADIGRVFPDVIWHTEKPVVRTAAAPLFILSRLVRDSGYKVILTGEGADEVLAGYDIFKEAKIREFIKREPSSRSRPLLLKRLYPYLARSPVKSTRYAELFFMGETEGYPAEYASHVPRWMTTSKIKVFFSDALKEALLGYENIAELEASLSEEKLLSYDVLSRAQYLEIKTLLPGYLLSSQGDRVAMANSIEGRFPFLDHRVMEFSCSLPPVLRMNALREKYLLKECMQGLLPGPVLQRTKQPYMAPDSASFFSGGADYVQDLLSERRLAETGLFNPAMVLKLAEKCRKNHSLGFKDNMAIVGIISTLLLHEMYVSGFSAKAAEIQKNSETGAIAYADKD